ncbi:MAG: hypothetical protein JWL95_514 [Gemmatimonadetes bacterium]|nr:hypothetical protein [Gemmatimonadota bacterium]
MDRSIRTARAALAIAGSVALLGSTSRADAQRPLPRIGVAAPSRPPRPVGQAAQPPIGSERNDPRWRNGPWSESQHARRQPNGGGRTVIYVPVPAGYGYGYSQQAYYPQGGYGGVYDANGRPLTAGVEPSMSGGAYAYTPDLSGSPYTVTNEGMMVVDFDSGERRAFPSCANQEATRDPNGRPRTIFYQPTDYWMVLRPGQRGRVQGTPAGGVAACYAIDSLGRVVLRF